MIRDFIDSMMDPTATNAPMRTSRHPLLVVASVAGVLLTLAWAAIQVRESQLEAQRLREDLVAVRNAWRAAGAAARAVPVEDHGARAADLRRRLAEAEAQQKQAAEKSAAREKELDKVIEFLREENTAAQQTIERLSNPEPAPAPTPGPGANVRKGVPKPEPP